MDLTGLFLTFSLATGLPPGLLDAVCYVESKHKVEAVRHKDGIKGSEHQPEALGVCQLHMDTVKLMARVHKVKAPTKAELMKPEVNIYYAALYLKWQLDRKEHKGNFAKAVNAFNSGTTYGTGGSDYLAKVFDAYWQSANKGGYQ